MEKLIRVGVMPGKISEYVVEKTATFEEVIEMAELDTEGYEVKADGEKVENLQEEIGDTTLLLLAKQVKGN